MSSLVMLLDVASGQGLPAQDDGKARRIQLTAAGFLAALLCSALWGAAAGSSSAALAVANLLKVPVVVLLSTLAALPAGLLSWKLSGARIPATSLLLSYASGIFSGTLVLAVLAPLVAVYYHSSSWTGPVLGLGSAFFALAVAIVVIVRAALRGATEDASRPIVLFPVLVFSLIQVATLIQFIALVSPILPEVTVFDGGIDAMLRQ